MKKSSVTSCWRPACWAATRGRVIFSPKFDIPPLAIFRTDIERALDEVASQGEGMRFQGLAVVLGKKRWPELIAGQRKKHFGLDAYAPARLTPEKIGKGLAASITPTLKKISTDIETAKRNFVDLKAMLFVTQAKVGNADRKQWEEVIQRDYGVELHVIEREEIITLLMMPENASLRASFLQLDVETPPVAEAIQRYRDLLMSRGGRPGGGKSTALSSLVAEWSRRNRWALPIHVSLRRLAEDGRFRKRPLREDLLDIAVESVDARDRRLVRDTLPELFLGDLDRTFTSFKSEEWMWRN